ncbi:MAG: lipid A deacylase LpxR family protein [Elusimicrobia bacterium]|nr:lipid A deacylase LpxR family protein [Elusimicrobiota bacterium]
MVMVSRKGRFDALTLVATLVGTPLAAAPLPGLPAPRWELGVRFENDFFAGTDRGYTNGGAVSVTREGAGWLAPLADRLPWGRGRRAVSVEAGQLMFTPADLSRSSPDPSDRPYAALLFAAVSLHVDTPSRYDGFKLVSGVVGPGADAAQAQRMVHRAIHDVQPQGWGHQLRDEPILNLVYEQRRKLPLAGDARGLSAQALPSVDVMAGNVLDQLGVGARLRVGWRVPDDFGGTLMRGMVEPAPPRRSEAWGFWLFSGVEGDAIARNLTLDGNTFVRGPRVRHRPFLPVWDGGFGAGNGRFQFTFTRVYWGQEFYGQKSPSRFGAIDANFLF